MRLIVTRPADEGSRWVELLRARGQDAVALPLLAIQPAPDAAALRSAWSRLPQFDAAMFVSANAVQGFFAAAPGAPWPGLRAWAPGPGTREALLRAGVPADAVDAPAADAAQFDSESLWASVQDQLQKGQRLLLVRGAGASGRAQGREWLSQQLAAAGVEVEEVAAYARSLPAWGDPERALARAAAADGSLWLFSSAEAANQLPKLLPGQAWDAARALATHPRIAAAVRALGFGYVQESRPGVGDLVASIESAR